MRGHFLANRLRAALFLPCDCVAGYKNNVSLRVGNVYPSALANPAVADIPEKWYNKKTFPLFAG